MKIGAAFSFFPSPLLQGRGQVRGRFLASCFWARLAALEMRCTKGGTAMTRHALVFSLTVSLGVTATAAAAENTAHPFAHVRAVIQDIVITGSAPSMSVAVAKDGKIIWEEGF